MPSSQDRRTQCGLLCFRPRFLQCFANLITFTIFYCPTALFTSALAIYIASQITTLERYFGFTSSQSGLIMSCNDIGFVVTVLFVSSWARKVHIPFALSISTIVYGISGVFCALAYFCAPRKSSNIVVSSSSPNTSNFTRGGFFMSHETEMCKSEKPLNVTNDVCDTTKIITGAPTEYTNVALTIIAIGMVLQGCGKSPRQPYLTTYIDDNVDKHKTALYLGVIVSVSMFGPALGFGLGAVFSKTYVTLEEVSITIMDPRWVGAWWLGFIFFGIISILFAFPLLCFPRHMKRRKRQNERENGVNKQRQRESTKSKTWKELFLSLKRLLCNARYVLLLISVCITILSVGGSIVFTPKYLESQFNIPTWYANTLMGIVTVVAASLGTLVGGLLTTCLKFSPLTCIKFATTVQIITIAMPISGLYIGCPNPDIIGYNTDISSFSGNFSLNTTSTCSQDCFCDESTYFPVCGSNGVSYMSPCQAGCKEQHKMTFTNCTCIGEEGTSKAGLCEYSCNMLWPYLAVLFIGAFIGTMSVMPTGIYQLRCVSDDDKAIAVGLTSFLHTLLGWMPGPVIFGKVIDTSCRLWNSNCLGRGACSMYDIEDFRFKRHILDLCCKCLTSILMIIIVIISRNRSDWSTDPHDKNDDIGVEGETFLPEKLNLDSYYSPGDPIIKKKHKK